MVDQIDIISGELKEAAFDPTCWGEALDSINAFVGGSGAVLLSVDERLRHAPTSTDLAEMMSDYFCNGWHSNDRREGCRPLLAKNGLVLDYEFQDPEKLENCDYYVDFLSRHKRKWFAGLGANLDGELWCIALQRSPSKGPFVAEDLPRLRAVQARFMESAFIARAVSTGRLAGAFDTFNQVDCAAMVLDRQGRIIEMSSAARELIGSYVDRLGHLHLPGAKLHLGPQTSYAADRCVAEIGRRSYTLEFTRLFDRSAYAFSKASFLVRISPCRRDPIDILKIDYGLTAAESRVAIALASGLSVDEISVASRVTANTVRMHLKATYAKTATGTQSKLVAFISAMLDPDTRMSGR